jgi:ethanolamine utilization protein EutN
MRVAEIIGRVTLNRHHPSLTGATWLLGVPLTLEGLRGDDQGRGEPIVIYDERGAGEGSMIAVSEGAEASAPFHPNTKPIDAYNAAIIDHLEVEPK